MPQQIQKPLQSLCWGVILPLEMRCLKQPQRSPSNGEAVEKSLKLLASLRNLTKLRAKLSKINTDFVGFVL